MVERTSTLLKRIILSNQRSLDKIRSKEFPAYGFLTESKERTTQFIWFDDYSVVVDDPIMIDELGGEELNDILQHTKVCGFHDVNPAS